MLPRWCRDGRQTGEARRVQFTTVLRLGCRGLAVASLSALLLVGCAPREPIPLPERPQLPYGEGRIWQVDGEGLEPSYVFGTYHISDPKVLNIPDAVERAFVSSEIAAFEYDHDPEKEEKVFKIDRVKLPKGTTLNGVVGNSTYGKLRFIMEARDRRPRKDVKPWVFWYNMGGNRGTFYSNDDESDPNKAVLDAWLQERARDEGKKVVGLETLEEGFSKYNTIPLPIQAELLRGAVENYHNRRSGTPMVQSYVDGDLALLMAIWYESLSWYGQEAADLLHFRIITNRNRIMVERMEPLMKEGSTFVAVGAAHLPGEDGVLRLLEQQGYTLTRLY